MWFLRPGLRGASMSPELAKSRRRPLPAHSLASASRAASFMLWPCEGTETETETEKIEDKQVHRPTRGRFSDNAFTRDWGQEGIRSSG
eukprot:1226967-Pyramimonas_sp.AAC.1